MWDRREAFPIGFMSLQRFIRDKKIVEFAGAKIDLFHVDSQRNLHRYKSNRISLGYKDQDTTQILPTKEVLYEPGDLFAIVTDGLTDQPGGDHHERPVSFGYRRFSNIILKHKEDDCTVIAAELRSSFMSWQGSQTRRDDVTVVLFKL